MNLKLGIPNPNCQFFYLNNLKNLEFLIPYYQILLLKIFCILSNQYSCYPYMRIILTWKIEKFIYDFVASI